MRKRVRKVEERERERNKEEHECMVENGEDKSSLQICRYADMQRCRYAGTQICAH